LVGFSVFVADKSCEMHCVNPSSNIIRLVNFCQCLSEINPDVLVMQSARAPYDM